MPKGKSPIKDIVINVLLLALAGGVLAWRYNDCKKRERAAEQAAVMHEEAVGQARERRTNACLTSVPEAARTDCIRCTCSECLQEFESCAADKECLAITVDTVLADGGLSADSLSRRRYEARAVCMYSKCGQACAGRQ